jgi:hypothetical protein
MNAWSAAHRGVARRPVLTFMLVSLGAGFLAAAIPPLVDSEILPFGCCCVESSCHWAPRSLQEVCRPGYQA